MTTWGNNTTAAVSGVLQNVAYPIARYTAAKTYAISMDHCPLAASI